MAKKAPRKPDRCCYVIQWWSEAASSWMGMEHHRKSGAAIRSAEKIAAKRQLRVRVVCMEQWVIFQCEIWADAGKEQG